MSTVAAPNAAALKKRIMRFLRAPDFASTEAAAVVRRLATAGEAAILGGMIRDIALHGSRGFSSDLDLVVDHLSRKELERLIQGINHRRNRFGGYRLDTGRWRLDVWLLPHTWAVYEGLVKAENLSDLVHTTFFNWDSAVFVINSCHLSLSKDYLPNIHGKYLDLILEKNPNDLGAVVRTLRFLRREQPVLAPKLSSYLARNLQRFDSETLLAAERKSYHLNSLSPQFIQDVRSRVWRTGEGLHSSFSTNSQLDMFEEGIQRRQQRAS